MMESITLSMRESSNFSYDDNEEWIAGVATQYQRTIQSELCGETVESQEMGKKEAMRM